MISNRAELRLIEYDSKIILSGTNIYKGVYFTLNDPSILNRSGGSSKGRRITISNNERDNILKDGLMLDIGTVEVQTDFRHKKIIMSNFLQFEKFSPITIMEVRNFLYFDVDIVRTR